MANQSSREEAVNLANKAMELANDNFQRSSSIVQSLLSGMGIPIGKVESIIADAAISVLVGRAFAVAKAGGVEPVMTGMVVRGLLTKKLHDVLDISEVALQEEING